MNKLSAMVLLLLLLTATAGCIVEEDGPGDDGPDGPLEVQGAITNDTTWSGEVLAKGYVGVGKGVTLTIEPGTTVRFRTYRGYKETGMAATLEVQGGSVVARGTRDRPITFTSDAADPVNGDWSGILVMDSPASVFEHVVVEFGQVGIAQFDSAVPVRHSIVRWCNSEGLYAERSSPVFEGNLLYSNAYHEIALEQYNTNVTIRGNVIRDGHGGVHCEMTEATITGNHFVNYTGGGAVSAGMSSTITVKGNRLTNVPLDSAVEVDDTVNATVEGNGPSVAAPVLDVPALGARTLGYVPGDPGDRFAYVYAEEDETRRVVRRLGENLSFGWSLAFHDGSLWRFSIGSGTLGAQLDLIRIDVATGEVERFANDVIMNPRGLASDGEHFYVNDFTLLKIFRFTVTNGSVDILDSFDIPRKEEGGTSGLACDGQYLYLMARGHEGVHVLERDGTPVRDMDMPGAGGSIVWTGEHFWVAAGGPRGIGRYTRDGNLAGSIFPVAAGTWAIAWDGTHLWTLQRTCELWNDAKIFEIEVLDDSLVPP